MSAELDRRDAELVALGVFHDRIALTRLDAGTSLTAQSTQTETSSVAISITDRCRLHVASAAIDPVKQRAAWQPLLHGRGLAAEQWMSRDAAAPV